MDLTQYNFLRHAAERRLNEMVESARRDYESAIEALEVVWGLTNPDLIRSGDDGVVKLDLIDAVRGAATELRMGFSIVSVENHLRQNQPAVVSRSNPWSLRKSISSALRRLLQSGFLQLEVAGRGTNPALYSLNGEHDYAAVCGGAYKGKELNMGNVSSKQA